MTEDNEDNKVKLRVGEVPPNAQQDIGRGIVRIDSKVMEELNVTEGEAVMLTGDRDTVGRVARSYPADKGLGIARMDGYMRKNAGTSLGENVEVSRAELKEAKKITLAPAEEGVMIQVNNPNVFKRALHGRAVMQGDIVVPDDGNNRRKSLFDEVFDMEGDQFRFTFPDTKLAVVSTKPSGPVKITEQTEIEMKEQAVDHTEQQKPVRVPEVTYEDIGGLENEIQQVREMIELPLKHPEVFQQLGIDAPSGVLLHGPPGTGKTLLAKAVANEADATFLSINGPEIMSKYYGESEKQLREKFEEAQDNSPAIIFIDEIDAIASKRDESGGEVERRVVAQLLSLMDGLEERENVIVIAATNRVDAVDPALRRGGRFDREIEIGVPNREGRKEIMQIHTRNMPLTEEVDLDEISEKTHGYVGADLEAVCKEAAMSVLRRHLPQIDLDEEIPSEVMEKLKVDPQAMTEGIRKVEPSAMREVMVEVPKVSWDDIGGLESTKEQLQEMVEWPQKYPERFDRMGIDVPRGILLYGLPGTGKTLLAKAVANEANANFISIKGPEVFCLSGDTPIVTDFCGRRTIEEFYSRAKEASKKVHEDDKKTVYEPQEEIKTKGIKDGEIVDSKVERFYSIQVPESFRFSFEDGSSIHVSGNQPFYTKDGWKKAEDLEQGEKVAAPSEVQAFRRDRLEWDQLDQNKFYLEKNGDLKPLEEAEIEGENQLTYARKLTSEEKTIQIPEELNERFSELLGWIAAEGHISEDEVRIAAENPENRERIRDLLGEIFNTDRINEREDGFAVYSRAFVELLHQGFDFPRKEKTGTVGVPGMLFKASEENWNGFLRGAYRGDGFIGKKKIEYCSKSQELVNGVATLLRFKGFTPKKFEDQKGYFHVNISGKGEISQFRAEVMGEDLEIQQDNRNKQRPMPEMKDEVKELRDNLRMTYGRDIKEGLIAPITERDQKFGQNRADRLLQAFKERVEEVRELEIERSVKSLREAKDVLKITWPELEMELDYNPKYQLSRKDEFGEKHEDIRAYMERVRDSILSDENREKLYKLETATQNLIWKEVNSKEAEGETTMYDLETSTGSLLGGETPLMLHNSKYVGESEEAVREIFQKARQVAPCIVFIDEIDSIAPKRGSRSSDSGVGDRVVNQLLTELDGVESLEGVTIIAATNRPDMIDPAVLRPGRLDRSMEVEIPDEEARKKIFEVHTENMPLADDVSIEELAEETEGYVGSDIESICREAGMNALRNDVESDEVTRQDFEDAIDNVRPTATDDNIEEYQRMMEKLQKIESGEPEGSPDYYA
ncbi:MAG: AAA family ATPase [Candidatus Nanohaloarchaea archaeon]